MTEQNGKLKVGDYVQLDYAEAADPIRPYIGRVTQIPYVSEHRLVFEGKVKVTFMLQPWGAMREIIRDESALTLVMSGP